jgi:TatD DNase family protein
VKLGGYISASGIITFKKSQALRDSFASVPLERLLVETDSPYLAPEPYRGKPCEPAYTAFTAKKLAEVKEVTVEELAAVTTDNFFTLFSKAKRP